MWCRTPATGMPDTPCQQPRFVLLPVPEPENSGNGYVATKRGFFMPAGTGPALDAVSSYAPQRRAWAQAPCREKQDRPFVCGAPALRRPAPLRPDAGHKKRPCRNDMVSEIHGGSCTVQTRGALPDRLSFCKLSLGNYHLFSAFSVSGAWPKRGKPAPSQVCPSKKSE